MGQAPPTRPEVVDELGALEEVAAADVVEVWLSEGEGARVLDAVQGAALPTLGMDGGEDVAHLGQQ